MRTFCLVTVIAFGCANAFTATPPHGAVSHASLAADTKTHIDKDYTASAGMNVHDIPFLIEHLTQENFRETLEMLEPLLTNECVGDVCDDYLTHLHYKAAEIDKLIPPTYGRKHH